MCKRMSEHDCDVCGDPATVAITGLRCGTTTLEFQPPEYRCEVCADLEGDEVYQRLLAADARADAAGEAR